MQVPNRHTSIDDTIAYFTNDEWGMVYESDKYWDDEVLFGNFIVFVACAFAWLNLPRPTFNQFMLAKHIADRSNPSRMLMAMRGLSKSLNAELYTAWRLYRDPDEHILVMSASATRAKNFTSFVQKLIKLIPCLQHMSPRHNIERTSGQSFDVAGAIDSDSPSVYAVGVENAIAGFRATIVIYDDIETKQNSTSIIMREKVDYYAKEAHNLLIAGKEETITLCTPHSKDSVYMLWITEGHVPLVIPSEYVGKDHFLYPYVAKHIRDRSEKFPSLIGKATDERINDKVLEDKRVKIGRSEYKLQYLLDVSESDELKHPLKLADLIVTDVNNDEAPIKIGHSSMPDKQIYIKHNGFKSDKFYMPSFIGEDTMKYQVKLMSIDTSGRGTNETAYSVIFILNGRVFVKDIGGFKGGYDDDTMKGIIQVAKSCGVNYIVIESNFGDGAFARIFQPYVDKYLDNVGIVEVRAKGQKELRIINTLEPLLNQHKIIFDKTLLDRDAQVSLSSSITYQISHITRERDCLREDDRIDSLEMACSYAVQEFLDTNEERLEEISKEQEMEAIMKQTNELFSDFFYANPSLNFGARY